jgi:hypothetical protein
VLFAYMQRLSGYSRPPLSRLIGQYTLPLDLASREPVAPALRANLTPRTYVLLAETDSLHDALVGAGYEGFVDARLRYFRRSASRVLSGRNPQMTGRTCH